MQGNAMEVGVVRPRTWEGGRRDNAWERHGIKGREKAVVGRTLWEYMKGDAMEVRVV